MTRHLHSVPPPDKPGTRFSTVNQVAAALSVSKMTVYRMVHDGSLPSYRFGRTALRIPTAAVWDYIRGNKIDPDRIDKVSLT